MKVFFTLFSLVLLFEVSDCLTVAPAGYSEKKPATEEIQKIADKVKEEIRKMWIHMDMYKAENFWEKIDEGTTYIIEINLTPPSIFNIFLNYITIEVHKPVGRRKAQFRGIVEREFRKPDLSEFAEEALLYEKNFEEQFLFEENQFKMVSGPTLPPMPNESEYSEKKNTTDEIQSMLKQVKVEGERKLNRRWGNGHLLTEWEASYYKTQEVPAGTFYEIMVQTDPYTESIVVILKKNNGKLKLQDVYAAIAIDTIEMFAPESLEHIIPESSENVPPESSEHVIPESSELVKPETSEHVIPEGLELVKPETSEHVIPESSENVPPETSEHVIPEISELVKPETSEHVLPESLEHVLPENYKNVLPDGSKDQ